MPGFPGPKSTVLSPVASKFVPVIVILLALPPAKGPEVGEIDVMVGIPVAEAGATPTKASVAPRVPSPSAAARRALLHRPAIPMDRGDSSAKPQNRRLMRYWPPPGDLSVPVTSSTTPASTPATPQTAREPCDRSSYGKRWPSKCQRSDNDPPNSHSGIPITKRHTTSAPGRSAAEIEAPGSVDRPSDTTTWMRGGVTSDNGTADSIPHIRGLPTTTWTEPTYGRSRPCPKPIPPSLGPSG